MKKMTRKRKIDSTKEVTDAAKKKKENVERRKKERNYLKLISGFINKVRTAFILGQNVDVSESTGFYTVIMNDNGTRVKCYQSDGSALLVVKIDPLPPEVHDGSVRYSKPIFDKNYHKNRFAGQE